MPDQADQLTHDDGSYVVRVYPVEDQRGGRTRTRWRTDAYYSSHRASTLARATFSKRDDAVICAEGLWADYVAGLHTAPEAAPRTVGQLVDAFLARSHGKKGRLLSAKTARSYNSQLASLTRLVGVDFPIAHLGRRHIEAITKTRRIERKSLHSDTTPTPVRPLSPRTIEQTLRAIRALV